MFGLYNKVDYRSATHENRFVLKLWEQCDKNYGVYGKTVTFKAGGLLAKGSFESLLIVSQWRGAQVGCRHPVARGISREVTLRKVTF